MMALMASEDAVVPSTPSTLAFLASRRARVAS